MSDDVFDKLDALIKKHAANEPEIPVLTDLVEPPRVDLNAIPVLTEEILAVPAPVEFAPAPEATHSDPAPEPMEAAASLAQIDEVLLDVPVEAESYPAEMPSTEPIAPPPIFSMEVPRDAEYIPLPTTVMETPEPVAAPAIPPAPVQTLTLPDETLHRIAKLIETDVARALKDSLHQTLSAELSGMLNITLDKALSSMLDQHMMMLEETVRSTIADELKKQLAPFKRPPPKA